MEADDTWWREHTKLQKHPRKLAKVILLAVMYGISPYSLADQILATPEEAEKFIQDFYNAYPVVRQYMDKIVAHADAHGYVQTMFGRKRRFLGHTEVAKRYHAMVPKIKEYNGGKLPSNLWQSKLPYKLKRSFWDVSKEYSRTERQSVNAVIQGSASDVLKRSMVEVYRHLETKDGWKLAATIHDEILIEIPDTATLEEIIEVEDIMKTTTPLNVPVKVDTEVMKRWGEGVPKSEWFNK